MKQTIKLVAVLMAVVSLVTFYSCSDDDGGESGPLTLTALTSGGIDLNLAASATGVAVDEPIVATFSRSVASSSTSAITMVRSFDNTPVTLDVTVDGSTVTITPQDNLSGGAGYVLTFGTGLKTDDNTALTTAITRSFTTAGTFVPDGVIAHFSFEDNANDVVGAFDPASGADVVDITYADSRNTAAGKAASFNGTTSIIDIPNGDQLLGSEFTLSFWMWLDSAALKTSGAQKGHFVMGVANFNGFQFEINDHEEWMKFATQYKRVGTTTDTTGTDFFFNADGVTLAETGREISTTVDKSYGKQGIRELIGKKWVNIIYTFSGSSKIISLFINGELVHRQDYKLFTGSGDVGVEPFGNIVSLAVKNTNIPAGQPDYYNKNWAFGFWQGRASTFPSWGGDCCTYGNPDNNHFKGLLDDVRFFHRVITDDEIELMYNSEKP